MQQTRNLYLNIFPSIRARRYSFEKQNYCLQMSHRRFYAVGSNQRG